MRLFRDAAGTHLNRRSNSNRTDPAVRTARWSRRILILLTVVSFIIPVGAFPTAGAHPLGTHIANPAPVAMKIAHAAPIHAVASKEVVPGSGSDHGVLLSPEALNAITVNPPSSVSLPANGSAGSPTFSKSTPAIASDSTLTPRQMGVGGVLKAVHSPAPAKAPAKPVPAGYNVPIGWFTGYVNDSIDRNGVAGVQVTLYSKSICPANICSPVMTDSSGYFNITCPAPGGPGSDDAIVISGVNWYMDNVSFHTCYPHVTTYVGTIFLVRDGVGIGFVKDSVSGNPVVGVTVQAQTRDGTVLGYPSGVSGINGSYVVALPPVPSKVNYYPPVGYLATFNYTNATPGQGTRPQVPPWLGGLNLHNMYMTRLTLVKAELYDSITMNPISGALAAMKACDAHGNGCQVQGITIQSGNTVRTFAAPGDDYLDVFATGHMESFSPALRIPMEAPGTVFDAGKVWVIPGGTFSTKGSFDTPTGGSPPWGAPGVGSIYATVCSMDGYFTSTAIPGTFGGFNMTSSTCTSSSCWSLGNSHTVFAPPLRVFVQIVPDSNSAFCNPFAGPQWPIPGYTPVWVNFTYVNLTAGHALPGTVWVNFTPGDYIAGHVYESGTTQAPQPGWIVSWESKDNSNFNVQPFDWNPSAVPAPSYAPCNSLGAATSGSFCLAVPPGNSKIHVTDAGYQNNVTWVHVPSYCCATVPGGPGYPASLASATANGFTNINLTFATGEVWGYVVVAGSGSTPVPAMTIQVCPAPLLQTAPCQYGFGFNGSFYQVPAPTGPAAVTISAAGYTPDTVWVNVTSRGNISAGTIPLYPLGTLSGKVVDTSGVGLYLADIHYCAIAAPGACYQGFGTNLGTGISGTDGSYNGTVAGGWLPWATYVVVATAPGYTTDWAFANVSAGGYTTLPTLTLRTIGVNDTHLAPHAAATTPKAAGVWISGRIIDNQTGLGVYIPPAGGINICLFGGNTCLGFPDGANTEGFFNISATPGLYYVNLSASGYMPSSVFLNATQAGYVDLGMIYIDPDWWVSGQVVIGPWSSVTISSGGTYGAGYGPVGAASGCDFGRVTCLNSLPLSANGTYNVSVPIGPSATISFVATGAPFGGSPAGGFTANTTSTNLSTPYTYLSTSTPVSLDIFGIIAGRVWNNNTINDSADKTSPAFGLIFPTITLLETGNHSASVGFQGDGGGQWIFFLPCGDGPNKTRILASDDPAYDRSTSAGTGEVLCGDAPTTGYNEFLQRFGWMQTTFVSTSNGSRVGAVQAQASFTDPVSMSTYTPTDVSDDFGFLNLTAPYGRHVMVTATAPDFNTTSFYLTQVNSSATYFANGTGVHDLGNYSVPEYGWIIANSLNFSADAPPLTDTPAPVVVDHSNGLGLPGALVAVSSSDPTVQAGGSAVNTNWNGQFYSDAPIGAMDDLQVSHLAYVTNDTIQKIHTGEYRIFSSINMTGDVVLAGRVVANPGFGAISGAQIQVCSKVKNQQLCSTAVSNVSGSFWVAVAPGDISMSVSATNYVSNNSFIRGCADCWIWAGTIVLDEYGTVTGNVRGLPSGYPLQGANVSLCSTFGVPTGPCGPSVTTNPYGHFIISAPPARYILQITDPNYNTTYLPIALSPGEITTVGTLFLAQFGAAQGRVYDHSTFAPLSGAAVYGCAKFSEGTCAPMQITDSSGTYLFNAAPGPYLVTASAQGYLPGNASVQVVAGVTTPIPAILLYPIGTNGLIPISGSVVSAADGQTRIVDATVAAMLGNSSEASGPTDLNGNFAFGVPYGTYSLVTTANGYRPSVLTNVRVNQPLSNLLIELSVMNYTLSGVTSDGLSNQPLSGVTIWTTSGNGSDLQAGRQVTTSDLSGTYTLALPNGTQTLMARGPVSSLVTYADTLFTVQVNGGPQRYDVSLEPALVTLHGRVVDAVTGLSLPGAKVTILGEVEPGIRFTRTLTADSGGAFVVSLYAGESPYTATATFGSYHTGQQVFQATPPSTVITISLQPISVAGVTPTSLSGWEIVGAGLAAVGIIALAAILAGRPLRTGAAPKGTGSGRAP